MPPETQNRDLTLPPDTYLYLQNEGKGGVITVHRGPTVVNQTGQDQPVKYESGSRTFRACSLEHSMQIFPRASEGDYVIVENPAGDSTFPKESVNTFKQLEKGRRVVIPGPWSEALWPGQSAQVIEGHRLRSNQFLVAIIYNSEQAEQNWANLVVKPQSEDVKPQSEDVAKETDQKKRTKRGLQKPDTFAVGTRIVIKGEDVSFFIPCTGVEVLKDEDSRYVREAVTLEQMEYCCLIDESGKREYPKGPAVVFPKPTQVFEKDSKSRRKWRPIELNAINGLHLKVTADFEDMNLEEKGTEARTLRKYKEGEELFVTGNTVPIYYPREELAIIEYGQGNRKHFSTAIPKGEGRYLIDRQTGAIDLIRGPKMLLPDPRTQILVRRTLSEEECKLMYPGNPEALEYNRDLAAAVAESPSGRSGVISEGDYRKRLAKTRRASMQYMAAMPTADQADLEFGGPESYEPEELGTESVSSSLTRGTRYTQPRQLTLNTKYDGAVKVEVWPGYSVLVVGAEGSRRVVVGPQVILLDYDEKLGHMELSTGKPKSTDNLLKTAYLKVQNNQIGDIIDIESSDHVKARVKISLRMNFEAEDEDCRLAWFGVDNYVKYLTDHVRSILAGMAKRHSIADIKSNYVDLVRDCILGQKPATDSKSEPLHSVRPGLYFKDNGMRVVEVEVLDLALLDQQIAKLIDQAQHQVVQSNIELEAARRDLDATKERERIQQAKLAAKHETAQKDLELQRQIVEDQLQLTVTKIEAEVTKLDEALKQTQSSEKVTDFQAVARLARDKQEQEQLLVFEEKQQELKVGWLTAETQSAVQRFEAAKDGLCEVLVSLQREDIAAKLAEGVTIERWLSGGSMESSIANLLSLSPTLQQFFKKADEIQAKTGNGTSRLTQKV